MQIEIFALCDAATADTGKLNMLGAFDTMWVAQTPAVLPHCAVALRVRFSRIERGDHNVGVSFVDMDGKSLIPAAHGVLRMNFPDEQSCGSANLILNLQGLKFEKTGEYAIDLAIDGEQKASLPLFVKARSADA